MKVYQISYDLRKQRNYDALYERIKTYHWCHPLESIWVITTQQSVVEVRDNLTQVMDQDDGLLVTRLTGEAAWINLGDDVSQWLKAKLAVTAA